MTTPRRPASPCRHCQRLALHRGRARNSGGWGRGTPVHWRRLLLIVGALVPTVMVGLIVLYRPDLQIRTATGSAADALCAKVFVSHLDPEASFAEIMDRPGIRRLRFGMRYHLDRTARRLEVSVG